MISYYPLDYNTDGSLFDAKVLKKIKRKKFYSFFLRIIHFIRHFLVFSQFCPITNTNLPPSETSLCVMKVLLSFMPFKYISLT